MIKIFPYNLSQISQKINMKSSVLRVFIAIFASPENLCSEQVTEIPEFRFGDGLLFLSGAFNQLLAVLGTRVLEDRLLELCLDVFQWVYVR